MTLQAINGFSGEQTVKFILYIYMQNNFYYAKIKLKTFVAMMIE